MVKVRQIVDLFEQFENDPSSLLLIPATSDHEQQLFDLLYNQVTDGGVVPQCL